MPKARKSRDKVPGWGWFAFFTIVAFIVWGAVGYNGIFILTDHPEYFDGVDFARSGQLGDTFGAVNALFSALGLAGVIYALILQIDENRRSADKDRKERRRQLAGRKRAAKRERRSRIIQAREQMRSARRDRESRKHASDLAMLGSLVEGQAAACTLFNDQHAKSLESMNFCIRKKVDVNRKVFDIREKLRLLETNPAGVSDLTAYGISQTVDGIPLTPLEQRIALKAEMVSLEAAHRDYAKMEMESKYSADITRNRSFLASLELVALLLYAEDQLGRTGTGADQGERGDWAARKHEYIQKAELVGYQSVYLSDDWAIPIPQRLREEQRNRPNPSHDPGPSPPPVAEE